MSPEVCSNQPYGFDSDMWALGCIVYEMCTLKRAFHSNNLLGLVFKIVKETYEDIPEQYSDKLRTEIVHVLSKEPTDRPNAQELLETLESRKEVIGYMMTPVVSEEVDFDVPPPPSVHRQGPWPFDKMENVFCSTICRTARSGSRRHLFVAPCPNRPWAPAVVIVVVIAMLVLSAHKVTNTSIPKLSKASLASPIVSASLDYHGGARKRKQD